MHREILVCLAGLGLSVLPNHERCRSYVAVIMKHPLSPTHGEINQFLPSPEASGHNVIRGQPYELL